MRISKHVEGMQFSPIRRFNPIAAKAEAEGVKVYKLNIGQPDIETPECFMEAVRNFDKKVIAYEQSQGDQGLIDSVIAYFKRDYNVDFTEDEIITTMGGSEALRMTFTTILNPNEKVIIPEPYYTNYSTFLKEAGGAIKPVVTSSEDGYRYAKPELLEPAVAGDVKAICCISPNNPTGLVLTDEEMEYLADFAIEHDLWLIADEVYREYVYDNAKPKTFASIDRIADRLIIIDSVSKRFSACGARVGFIACKNKEFMSGILKLAQGRLCIPTLDQVGAAELFKLPHTYYLEKRAEYEARRDAAFEEIMKIPGVVCKKPAGSFYMCIDLPVDDSEELLMFMLTEFRDNGETAMFAPAAGFYATPGCGKNEIRIAYVLKPEDMRRATNLIRLGIEAYNKRKGK